MNRTKKKILITLMFGMISCFITSTISFFLSKILPGDPVLPYIGEGRYSLDYYNRLYQELGLDQPIIIQLFRYIGDMLVGVWGYSLSLYKGYPVFELIMDRILPTLILLLIPLILGLVLGYLLGNYSLKFKSKREIKAIKIVSLTGVIIPIISLILSLPFLNISTIPILELISLWIILTIPIMSLTTIFVQLNFSGKDSPRRSNLLFIILLVVGYSSIYLFLIQTEILFSFEGIGELFLQAISSNDYYVINAIMFLMLFSLPIFIIFCLFSFFIFKKVKVKSELTPLNDAKEV